METKYYIAKKAEFQAAFTDGTLLEIWEINENEKGPIKTKFTSAMMSATSVPDVENAYWVTLVGSEHLKSNQERDRRLYLI